MNSNAAFVAAQARQATEELLAAARLERGDIFVVGCSSSEIVGGRIGHASSLEAAQAVFAGIYPGAPGAGESGWPPSAVNTWNRALVLERDCARQYGYDPVCVIPQPKAGGSFATTAWKSFTAPVAVEHIRAHAGLDIGGTMIGMHLRDVAVPVRLSLDHIGQAILLCARTRPKLIGGSRAVYE